MAGHVACWRSLGTATDTWIDQEKTGFLPENQATGSVLGALKGIFQISDPLFDRSLQRLFFC